MKFAKYNFYDSVSHIITQNKPYKQPYIFTDTVPADYTDITSIENINNFGFNMDDSFDYKRVRDEIKIIVESTGWANLTAAEQLIAAEHKIGTNAERAAAFGNDFNLMVEKGEEYHRKLLEVRALRMNFIKSNIHNRLGHETVGPYTAPEVILSEVTETVVLMYENEGLGGVYDGDNSEGVMDYINETAGTSYELGAGLRSKTWTPYGFANCSDLADYLLDYLQKGIK